MKTWKAFRKWLTAEEYAMRLPEKERARFLKMTKQIGKELGGISDKINKQ
jgi:hypothetical protein